MLKLRDNAPAWLTIVPPVDDVPAVEVLFAPITIKAVREAQAAIRIVLAGDGDALQDAGDAMTAALLRRGILEWRGIGDADGNPIPVTPETLELFIADPVAFQAADSAYVLPWSRRDAEKNVSSGSLPGTSTAAMPVNNTVTAPAGGASADTDAKPTRKPEPKRARTSSTSRKRTMETSSGR